MLIKFIILAVMFTFLGLPANAQTNNGLLAWWKLDDDSGSSAVDSSGNGYTQTVNNAGTDSTWVTGKIGYALRFDGTTSSGTTTSNAMGMTGQTANMTVALWFYRSSSTANGSLYKLGNRSNASAGDGFTIGVGSTDMDNAGSNLLGLYEGLRWMTAASSLGTGWYHTAMVINSSGYPIIYLNGKKVYSDTIGTMTAIGTYSPVVNNIGGYLSSAGQNRCFTGIIDDVRFYNRVLTPGEIYEIFEEGAQTHMGTVA